MRRNNSDDLQSFIQEFVKQFDSREEAAKHLGVLRQTLDVWVSGIGPKQKQFIKALEAMRVKLELPHQGAWEVIRRVK